MVKEFTFRGKILEEVSKMELKEFIQLLASRKRRTFKRGILEKNKRLIEKIKATKTGKYKKPIKTHARSMVVIPEMVGLTLHVYNGRTFVPINIIPQMLGYYLGELVMTRKRVTHSAPGIGATKSSTAIASKAK